MARIEGEAQGIVPRTLWGTSRMDLLLDLEAEFCGTLA
jgi:hypothetical protein